MKMGSGCVNGWRKDTGHNVGHMIGRSLGYTVGHNTHCRICYVFQLGQAKGEMMWGMMYNLMQNLTQNLMRDLLYWERIVLKKAGAFICQWAII